MILKRNTNELLQIIIDKGFEVRRFKLEFAVKDEFEFATIKYTNSPMYFYFAQKGEFFFEKFDIGFIKFMPKMPTQTDAFLTFEQVKSKFANWLQTQLSSYIDNEREPDRWEQMKSNPFFLKSIEYKKNNPFANEEKLRLKNGIEEIKSHLQISYGLDENLLKESNEKLDYLIKAVDRLDKTDWKSIAASIVIQMCIDLTLDQNKRDAFLELFRSLWATVQNIQPLLN